MEARTLIWGDIALDGVEVGLRDAGTVVYLVIGTP